MGDSVAAQPALELMGLHAQALFTHDARGRLVATREWTPRPAPRLFLGRTAEGNVWLFGAQLPGALVARLETLCRAEPVAADPPRSPAGREALLRALAEHAPVERVWEGPAYVCARCVAPARRPVAIDETSAAGLLQGGLEAWLPDAPHLRPFVAAAPAGRAVAVCASVRITPAAHEAGVETLPAFRRRGHAADVVAAWADAVRALGATPLYSTSWDNAPSQAVAARLGATRFGVDFAVT